MRFTVSSSELLRQLTAVSKVIPAKPTINILENFLFVLKGNELEITGSDNETTLKTTMTIEDVREEGEIVVPAKILTDSLKMFPDIPLEFKTINNDNTLKVNWASGESQFQIFPSDDYPVLKRPEESAVSAVIPSAALLSGINATLYATAEEELRPVMNGIFVDMSPEEVSFVASDSHKLVCYTRRDVKSNETASFILHKKPAAILKALLTSDEESVKMTYDNKNAFFEFNGTLMICRLIDGRYPAYKSVIPKNNQSKMLIDRNTLLNSVKRVSVCSNQATNHIKFGITPSSLTISAQDVGFNISSHETIPCSYDGEPMEIGFKANFITEILASLPFEQISMELADPGSAALILNAGVPDPDETITSLIMPVRVQ